MNWFYAEAGQQKGPFNAEQFNQLVREGIIASNTLVWREGMAHWEPLANVHRHPPPPVVPIAEHVIAPDQIICAECGKAVGAAEALRFENVSVCSICKPLFVQKLREGTAKMGAPTMLFAGFWIRLAAYVIDQVIVNIVALPSTIWITIKMQRIIQQATTAGVFNWADYFSWMGLSSAIGLLISIAYNVFFVGRYAATPGKLFLKIRIVTAEGGRVSYLRALGRLGGQFVSSFACMIGYLLPIWDREKRALHDMICNTRVVYK